MRKLLNKISYVPVLISKLQSKMKEQEDLSKSCDEINCQYDKNWHGIYAYEMRDMLGPFADDNKIDSLKKIRYIKEMIWIIRHTMSHDVDLAKQHNEGISGTCQYDAQYHLNWAKSWQEILGPWR